MSDEIVDDKMGVNVADNSGKYVFKILASGMFLWLSINSFHHLFTMLFEDLCFLAGIRVTLIYWIIEIGAMLVILFLLFLVLKKIERISHKLDKVIGRLVTYIVVSYVVAHGLQFFYFGFVQIHVRENRFELFLEYYKLIESFQYRAFFDSLFFMILLVFSSIMIYRKKERFHV